MPRGQETMPRRRRQKPLRQKKRSGPFHAPFRDLAGRVGADTRTAVPATAGAPPQPVAGSTSSSEDDDGGSFLRAVADVTPITADRRVDAPAPAAQRERPIDDDEETEALTVLSDLVSGSGEFDISDSAEYVEGSVVGLDRRIVRRLRRGEFSYQAILDLHGQTTTGARADVRAFVHDASALGHRCVLIVHGRGLNSRDQVPVLKERLKGWLAHGRVGRLVLAFTSARPADGGTGAVYVLLRRRRGEREAMDVYQGAKRD